MATLNDTPTQREVTSAVTRLEMSMSRSGSDGKIFTQSTTENRGSVSSIVPSLQTEIKHEPPEDINDIPHDISDYSSYSIDKMNNGNTDGPKIRLTPTIKLMPVSKPVDSKRRFACPYDNCTKSYGKSSHLRSHLTWHTGIKPFVCSEVNCGKGFTRSDELNRHLRTHTGEKPFECIQCTKKFSRSDHLTKHLATHAKQMQNSINGSKKPKMQGDGNRDKKGCELNEISVSKNSSEDTELSTESDQYSNGVHFMAAESVKSFRTEGKAVTENLTDNVLLNPVPIRIKLERPENSDEYHVVSPNSTGKADPFVTTPMLNVVSSESEYDMFSKFATSVTDETKSEDRSTVHCPTTTESIPEVSADGAFMGWPELGKGVSDDPYDPHRPWRCKLCTKSFKRQDDLNRHLRTHTGEKPFACVACERRFMRSDHLKKHLKTHTNLR